MDAPIQPAGGMLPPVPGMNPPTQPAPIYQPPQPQPPQPVGRPSSDPDRQQQRAERHQQRQRFVDALPKQATDSRVSIYRLRGRSGSQRESTPFLKILLSDLEEAKNNGTEPDDFITEAICEKDDRPARYICMPQDSHGKSIPSLASWTVEVNMDDAESFTDDDDDDTENIPIFDFSPNRMPPDFDGNFQQPPIMPPPDAMREAREMMREQREAEKQEKTDSIGMVTSMLTSMMNLSQQAQTMQMQMLQMQQVSDKQAAEERRREDERRAEREQARQEARTQLLVGLIPAIMPILTKVMEGKEDKITPVLLAKVIEGSAGNNDLNSIVTLMGEATKQQLLVQGEMTRNNIAQQSEASKMMMTHVLKMAQDTISAQRKLDSDKDDGPLDKLADVITAIGPMLSHAQPPLPAAATPQPVSMSMPQRTQLPQRSQLPPPQAAPQPAQPQQPQQTSQPTRETYPDVTDEQWLSGALHAVRNMSSGAVPPEQRYQGVQWMAQVLSPTLLQAIAAGDEQQVLQHSAPIVMADQTLMDWLSEDEEQEFLREIIEDIRQLLTGELTEARAEHMVAMQRAHVASQRGAAAETQPKPRPQKTPPPPVEETMEDVVESEGDQWSYGEHEPSPAASSEPEEASSDSSEEAEQEEETEEPVTADAGEGDDGAEAD